MSAAITAAVVGGAAAIYGAKKGADASEAASKRAASSADASLQAQMDMYYQDRDDKEIYRNLGEDAMSKYYQMLGIGGASAGAGTSAPLVSLTPEEQAAWDSYQEYSSGIVDKGQGATINPEYEAFMAARPGRQYDEHEDKAAHAFWDETPPAKYLAADGTPITSGMTGDGSVGAWEGDVDAYERARKKMQTTGAGAEGRAPELSPLAKWQMQEFNKVQNRQDAARGLSGSGGASARMGEGAMQIAGMDYQNSYNRILDALKLGSGAGSSAGMAGNAMTAIGQHGAQQQQNILNQGQSEANFWSGLGQVPGQMFTAYRAGQPPAGGGGGGAGAAPLSTVQTNPYPTMGQGGSTAIAPTF